ncbi:thioredoxin family protein [Plebeiibacterium sediminum]|uniref:Thioredoxin family protein n=1 Tax=Plebeiibacterium sediminum TaxID=2992112 RepID=A0AAE3M2E0_9BACT|nr:thioredoxin family protein [Plebeiobacterium sediminum]MCW3785706.1 thioredoxin family protein [Plebeiobacterium sediminum]
MKRKLALIIALLCAVFIVHGQDKDLSIDQAKIKAANENKRILLVFQGSDWCAPCIKLEKEILDTEEFLKIAEEQFVILKADFPRSKKNRLSDENQKHNAALAEKYNQNGYFPYVVILNAEGNVLGAMGYKKMTPQDYFDQLNAFK